MDNDNKIVAENKKNIHNEVLLFLGDELKGIHRETTSQSYDLEGEYEKTKNHKSLFVVYLLVGTVLAVIAITVGLSAIISNNDQKVNVSLSEFDDLNLKGLLDSVAKVQDQYDNALKNKMNLENDMETAIRAADSKLENDLFMIESMNLRNKSTYNKKVADAQNEYKQTLNQIHTEYDSQISLAEKEVEEFKKQLDEYNSTKIESAREQERLLNSERQLRDLQEKELTQKYENRISELEDKIQSLRKKNSENMKKSISAVAEQYQEQIDSLDPIINDASANAIISKTLGNEAADFNSAQIIESSSVANDEFKTRMEKFQAIYSNYSYLDSFVTSIPHKNSMPSYLHASRELVNEMGEVFVNTTTELQAQNDSLTKKIDKMQKDFDAEKKKLNATIKSTKEGYEQFLTNMLVSAKASAAVSNVLDEKIYIFIIPDKRESVGDEGINADIKIGRATVKGKIVKEGKSDFVFVPGNDKNGNPILIDYAQVIPGTTLKI